VRAPGGGFALVILFDLLVPGFLLLFLQFRIRFGCGGRLVGIFLEGIAGFPLAVFDDDIYQLVADIVS
jgi:hypothetical protein